MSQAIEDVRVAGTSWNDQFEAACSFLVGNNQELRLIRETDNEWDHNAIAVIGIWSDGSGSVEAQLGYVPAGIAEEIASRYEGTIPLHASLRSLSQPDVGFFPEIRIDIWVGNPPLQ